MASGMPGGSGGPKAAEYVTAMGKGFGAKVPGMDSLIPLDHPSTTVHLDTGTQFDPGGDQDMMDLHGAFHGGALPPALEKLIADAIDLYQQMQQVHDYAGSTNAMPGAGGDVTDSLGGLPGGSQMAA